MNLQQVVEKFLEKPNRMITGKSKLARQFKCSEEVIKEARKIARWKLKKRII